MPQLKRLTLVNVIPTSILSSLSARNGFLDEIVISIQKSLAKEENNDLVLAVSKANISHTVLILGEDNTDTFKAYSTGLSQNNYVKAVTLIGVSQRLRLGENDVEHVVSIPQLTKLQLSCLLYTSPSPRDRQKSRMPSSA